MLISGKLLTQLKDDLPSYGSDEFEPDMAFAAWMRERVNNSLCSTVCIAQVCLSVCDQARPIFQ